MQHRDKSNSILLHRLSVVQDLVFSVHKGVPSRQQTTDSLQIALFRLHIFYANRLPFLDHSLTNRAF